ncbi:hypothetical protein [Streptomyces sp. NBC_00096]|uniref:hypothetical protein n=1 Tax=Streptomyces sp. NBC_00096 TaxID=2975650 RepID=UPI0032535A3D
MTVNTDAEKTVSVASVLVEASRRADLLVTGGRRSPGYFGPTLGRTTHVPSPHDTEHMVTEHMVDDTAQHDAVRQGPARRRSKRPRAGCGSTRT